MEDQETPKIHARTIIEVLGKPKEHVEESIKEFVETIRNDEDVTITREDFAPAEQKSELWSSFVELEIIVKKIENIVSFCFSYMPSTVEILQPSTLKVSSGALSQILGDLQGRLHDVDMGLKILRKENMFVKENFNKILLNYISVLLTSGNKTLPELSKLSGVKEDELTTILESMTKENRIKKEEDKFSLVIHNG